MDEPGLPGEAGAKDTIAQPMTVTRMAKDTRRRDRAERQRWQQRRPHQRRATAAAAAAAAALALSTIVAVMQAARSAMEVLMPLPADVT